MKGIMASISSTASDVVRGARKSINMKPVRKIITTEVVSATVKDESV